MKESDSRNSMKTFSIIAMTTFALYAVNAVLLGKLGLFAFFSHSYSLAYQVMFLFVLTIVAHLLVRRLPNDWSLLRCGAIGMAIGYAVSVGCLVLAFAAFGQADGLSASMENFADGLSASPASSLIGFLFAAAISFGWFYGLVVFAVGHAFSAASYIRSASNGGPAANS